MFAKTYDPATANAKVLLGFLATCCLLAVAIAGSVRAGETDETISASVTAQALYSEAIAIADQRPVEVTASIDPLSQALTTARSPVAQSDIGYFVGTGDGNGAWIQR